MLTSVWGADVRSVIEDAARPAIQVVHIDGHTVEIPVPFPSPEDWRDCWIYFLVVDRFNNPDAPPRAAWDSTGDVRQGGSFNGVRARLGYLHDLGARALWLSPVMKNCQYEPSYHGYGIQDFLRADPRFASRPGAADDELRALVDEAHARGMYVIFDVVLNHAGDVFAYPGFGAAAPWSDSRYTVNWRDADGTPRPDWTEPPADPPLDAAVWPAELRDNRFFREQGTGGEAAGDFGSLKEFVTAYQDDGRYPVRAALIRAWEYVVARYDVDGFRIDSLKYIEPDFARVFGSAMREFALSIGKKNFFTFGEVYGDEDQIARFIGRSAADPDDLIGVDAALDYPLFYRLPQMAKAQVAPAEVAGVYERRKQVQKGLLSSHGDASRFFVTFLDNHDQHQRFHYAPRDDPHRWDRQTTLGLGLLFTLQGIPCLYYGTEQGLHGTGDRLEAVREALWGIPDAFDEHSPFFLTIRALSALRDAQPPLRYGRQYFRPVSSDGVHFGLSPYPGGVLAFSRILADQEIVVVANTSTVQRWEGEIIVDAALNPKGKAYGILYSTVDAPAAPGPVMSHPTGSVSIIEVDGAVSDGPIATLPVALAPMEIQVLG